ncbi:MAG: acetyl-CoA carboxylase biotin carboxyl carrier protein subunit, partial [Guyparkeria sp.]
LLRFFDQIRFYEVSEEELLKMRDAFPHGGIELTIEETTFSLGRYNRFIEENAAEIRAFKERQQAAFEAERQHWIATGQANYESEAEPVDTGIDTIELEDGQTAISEHVHGVVWKLEVDEGDRVEPGQTLMVLESMKMEIHVDSEVAGTVARLLCREGDQVKPGQTLIVLDNAE